MVAFQRQRRCTTKPRVASASERTLGPPPFIPHDRRVRQAQRRRTMEPNSVRLGQNNLHRGQRFKRLTRVRRGLVSITSDARPFCEPSPSVFENRIGQFNSFVNHFAVFDLNVNVSQIVRMTERKAIHSNHVWLAPKSVLHQNRFNIDLARANLN
jgi:hypothetical protein